MGSWSGWTESRWWASSAGGSIPCGGTLTGGSLATASNSATSTSTGAATPATTTTHTEVVHTTTNHPWLTADHGWMPASFLQVGESVQEADGATATVVAIRAVPGATAMWNLTVANVHTFAVGVGQFVVHNCDSAKLGRNLQNAGYKEPEGVDAQAHHIVPCGCKKASFAQSILAKHGIDIDSADNGVWLSQKGHAATFRGTNYDWLNESIRDADRSGGSKAC